MKSLKNILAVFGLAMVMAFIVTVGWAESRNTTGTTESLIVFGPKAEGYELTAVEATSDVAGSKVTVRVRNNSTTPNIVNGSGSTSQAVIPLAVTTGLSSNDYVVVSAPDHRFAAYRGRVITVTSSNITLDANLTAAVQTADRVQELSTVFTLPVGSNSVNRSGTLLIKTPSDSPVVLQLNSTAASELSATTR